MAGEWTKMNAGCTHHSLFQSSRDGAHIFLTVGLSFAGAGGKNKYIHSSAAFSPSQATTGISLYLLMPS
jgi:hypothetical protein